MDSVEFGSLSLYTMHKRIKNIIKAISGVYYFCLSLIYEERHIKPKRQTFDSRTISPPRRGSLVEKILCGAISNQDTKIPYVFSYLNNHVHSSIYWFKYGRDKYTTEFLSRALLDEIIWIISDKLDKRQNIKDWIVTFAPSTSFQNGTKGWDHNRDIVESLKKISNFNFQDIFKIENILATSNKKLSKHDRQNSSLGKFSLLPEARIPDNSGLIIFDDVTTTGSTLANLEKLAENLKPKMILIVAIAH